MPVVLLIKAVEEADSSHALLPLADREQATRETLRALKLPSDGMDVPSAGRRYLRALADRAQRLLGILDRRYPVVGELLGHLRWPAWLSVLIVLAAFATGMALASLQEARRINILAFPFLGVIAWNLAIYAVLAVAALQRGAGLAGSAVRPATGRGLTAVTTRVMARPLRAIAKKTAQVHAVLGRAVEAFVGEWTRHTAPVIAARSRRLLHLGSAVLALGLIAGLYFRGIVFQYEAGWESTFLDPPQVRDVLGILFGPASRLSGVPLPATTEAVAALRWDGAAGGGDAAPWIHLIAVTLAIYVVVPRLLLAGAAWLGELRRYFGSGMPSELVPYARRVFGAPGRGLRSAVAAVIPYAYEPPPGAVTGLGRLLEKKLGAAVRLAMQPVLHYGDEARAGRTVTGHGATTVDAQVLLFSMGATPESENHGDVVAAVRDAAERLQPPPELLVVIDEAPFAARLTSELATRIAERRELWRTFLDTYGLEATFLTEAETGVVVDQDASPGTDVVVDRSASPGRSR
jgi:hypothetical protein